VASLPAFEDVSDSDFDVDYASDGGREGGGRTSLGHGDMDQHKYVDADGEDEDEEEDDVGDLLEEDAKASGVLPLLCEAAHSGLKSSVAVVFVRVYAMYVRRPPSLAQPPVICCGALRLRTRRQPRLLPPPTSRVLRPQHLLQLRQDLPPLPLPPLQQQQQPRTPAAYLAPRCVSSSGLPPDRGGGVRGEVC
jgi:hypothetical protein